MKASEITAEVAADIIISNYEKRFVPKESLKLIALVISDSRRLSDDYLLAKAYACDWAW